jgi:hypothetical protein
MDVSQDVIKKSTWKEKQCKRERDNNKSEQTLKIKTNQTRTQHSPKDI